MHAWPYHVMNRCSDAQKNVAAELQTHGNGTANTAQSRDTNPRSCRFEEGAAVLFGLDAKEILLLPHLCDGIDWANIPHAPRPH